MLKAANAVFKMAREIMNYLFAFILPSEGKVEKNATAETGQGRYPSHFATVEYNTQIGILYMNVT